ncbi:MAG: pyridoxamine 5'-phosphate oxidase [Flavobacteriales bacterium]|nr:pyridoxamine 5'-phosphate oxidase [Flavobacteriales bacterium]
MASIEHLRENYSYGELLEKDVPKHPYDLFDAWFKLAVEQNVPEPNAMILGTVSAERKPRARVVLLKDYTKKGFTFYTNYQSDKGREIEFNNNVCLTFIWLSMARQVRIEGKATKLSPDESELYFNSRPQGNKIGAIISEQSQPIDSRDTLEKRLSELDVSEPIERPKNWGGYLVKPVLIEFWQGRENRLHDRIQYTLRDNRWTFRRLQP